MESLPGNFWKGVTLFNAVCWGSSYISTKDAELSWKQQGLCSLQYSTLIQRSTLGTLYNIVLYVPVLFILSCSSPIYSILVCSIPLYAMILYTILYDTCVLFLSML